MIKKQLGDDNCRKSCNFAAVFREITDKMKRIALLVRQYPLSSLCVVAVFYLSLFFLPPEELDLSEIAFADKWTHMVMYGGTASVMWWEHLRRHRRPVWRRLLLFAGAGLIVLGGVLELLQEYCTETRAGEWLDFVADTVGVLLGGLLMWSVRKYLVRA